MLPANWLTLIVHGDHLAPLVAVRVSYHMGSKNEPKGKTGFARLFAHLMFAGSEHSAVDDFKATEKLDANEPDGKTVVAVEINQLRLNFESRPMQSA